MFTCLFLLGVPLALLASSFTTHFIYAAGYLPYFYVCRFYILIYYCIYTSPETFDLLLLLFYFLKVEFGAYTFLFYCILF